MFFRKYRENKKAKREEKDRQQIVAMREAIAKAEATPDIGEKLILLDDLRKDVSRQCNNFRIARDLGLGSDATIAAAMTSGLGVGVGSGIATGLGIAKAAAALAIVLPGALVLVPVGIGIAAAACTGRFVGKRLGAKNDASFNEKHKELLDAFNDIMPKIEALHAEALGHGLQEFAASRQFDTLYSRFPDLKDRFVKEAFRKDKAPEAGLAPEIQATPGIDKRDSFKL